MQSFSIPPTVLLSFFPTIPQLVGMLTGLAVLILFLIFSIRELDKKNQQFKRLHIIPWAAAYLVVAYFVRSFVLLSIIVNIVSFVAISIYANRRQSKMFVASTGMLSDFNGFQHKIMHTLAWILIFGQVAFLFYLVSLLLFKK